MLLQTMNYASTQLILEHFGVFVSAITGVLAARGKRVDLFGVLVLALVTAFGGGTVRDLLAGDLPVVWLRNPGLLGTVLVATFLTFFIAHIRHLPAQVLLIADAFALALFTIMGVQKGISLNFSVPVSILLGVITGVAGGILRDVLTGEVPMVFRPDIYLYATASLCGATLLVALNTAGLANHSTTAAAGVVVLALRMGGIYWKLSLPVYEA